MNTARGLLAAATPTIERRGLTLVGVAVTNLENDSPLQLALPFDRRCTIAVDLAVDEIRERFGLNAITRAVLLGRDTGFVDAAPAGLMTLLAEVVAASQGVAETSSRSRKIATLAELLRQARARTRSRSPSASSPAAAPGPRRRRLLDDLRHRASAGGRAFARPSAISTRRSQRSSASTGSGSAARRASRSSKTLFARATADEADFIRRLFTGELRQGALAGLMVDAVAKAAEVPGGDRARARSCSRAISRAPREIALDRGRGGPARRRLRALPADPADARLDRRDASASAVAGFDRASVEWKLDGIRIQIHRRGDEVRIYTRNLNDITARAARHRRRGAALAGRQAVLDGEALWMARGRPGAFQDTVARIDSEAPPEGIVTFLFDLLHVDGEDLLDTPLQERAARLDGDRAAAEDPGGRSPPTPDEAQRVLDEALRAGHEGVVVKDAASLYAAGRRGKAWRKVKPVRTYDLVVLGAEWGHGRRQGWLSNLHLGARDADTGGLRDGRQVASRA